MEYDVIIIGAGPGGLTAALYAARYNLKTLVIGQLVGGMTLEAFKVCNFPSYENISGLDLIKKMEKQVKELGVEIKTEEVTDIKKGFKIVTNKAKYSAKKIILATGTKKVELHIPNEKKFLGKGVSYCATCDAGLYRNKVVGVVGGGNSAVTSALLLSQFAKKVYIIYRQKKFFRAEPTWVKEVEANKKIEPLFETEVEELIGKEYLKEVKLSNGKNLKIDGLFIEGGCVPWNELSKKLKLKLDGNYVVVDKFQKTNVKGVFAVGDMTDNPLKQIVTACGDGAIAADSAYKELIKEKN